MNTELINLAQKAADELKNSHEYHQASDIISMLIEEIKRISNESTATWIEYTGEDEGFHYCSKCKKAAFNYQDGEECIEILSDFCPHCGRKMIKH